MYHHRIYIESLKNFAAFSNFIYFTDADIKSFYAYELLSLKSIDLNLFIVYNYSLDGYI